MKTVREVREIIEQHRHHWCKTGIDKALYLLKHIDDNTTLDKVVEVIKIPSSWAYQWALDIGDKDIMIDRITDSKYAYYWALDIGDKDIMIDRVTDSEYAYYWAYCIGDRDIMINRVISSKYAYYWAKYIGDRDIMVERITDPKYKYKYSLIRGQ